MSIEHQYLDSFSIDSLESKGIVPDNRVFEFVLDESTLLPTIKPAIMDPLEKQQNNRFYDFNQHQISSKLQTAFIARIKVHRWNLLSELCKY